MQKINTAQFGRFFIGVKMRKTLAFLFAFVAAAWIVPAAAVGTIPGISLSQQLDSTGKPLGGGLLYLIQAGTTSTPQNCYQDTGLTIPYPNPVVLDAYGRAPQLFCADGQIKVRLTDKNGVQVFVQDNLLIVGASSGGGGGGSVDPTTVLATGDIKYTYGASILPGWVRLNGRTIGSSTSGATERANADTQALFLYLWGEDSSLAVSGGRGASAAADWAANKTIALPDFRGRVIGGLDDMGNAPAGRLTSTYWGSSGACSGVTPAFGVACGGESQTLTPAQLPSITSSGSNTIAINAPNSENFVVGTSVSNNSFAAGPNTASIILNPAAGNSVATGVNTIGVTSTNTSGQAHPNVMPEILTTVYIKL